MIKNFIKLSSLALLAIVIASCGSSSSSKSSNADKNNFGFPTFSTDKAKTKIQVSTASATQLAQSTLQADSSEDTEDAGYKCGQVDVGNSSKVFYSLSDSFICTYNFITTTLKTEVKNLELVKDGKDHSFVDSSNDISFFYNYGVTGTAGNEVNTLTFSQDATLDSANLKSKNVFTWSDGAVKSLLIKTYSDDQVSFIQGYQTADGSFEFEFSDSSLTDAVDATNGQPAVKGETSSTQYKLAFDFATANFAAKLADYTNPNPVNGKTGQDSTKLVISGNGATNFAVLKAEIEENGAALATDTNLYCGKLDTEALATDPKCDATKKTALTAKADSDFTAFTLDPATFNATLTTKVKGTSALPSSISEQFTGFAALFAPTTTN